jgi:hypothetical protein
MYMTNEWKTEPVVLEKNSRGLWADLKGKEQNSGMKADNGKIDLSYLDYFPRALEAVCGVSQFGNTKYTKLSGQDARGSWQTVPDGKRRYAAALLRHHFRLAKGEEYDDEPTEYGLDPVHHAAQRAWNALATLELILREKEV